MISRVIVGERAAIRFPLPEVRPYLLTPRANPPRPPRPAELRSSSTDGCCRDSASLSIRSGSDPIP